MTQIFTEDGDRLPVTVIEAGPCVITQVKTRDRDGYTALQMGFGEVKERKAGKPMAGHFGKAGVKPLRHLAEIRVDLEEVAGWVKPGEQPGKKKEKKARARARKEEAREAEAEEGEASQAAGAEEAAEAGPVQEAAEPVEPEAVPGAEREGVPRTGDVITVEAFKEGQLVKASGISKGKGFAGVIKRHGFAGGPGSHGAHFHRAPGSVGASASPSRVFKGLKLPGQMGNRRSTQRGLTVVKTDPENNLLFLKGSVPGGKNGIIFIQTD
ncbi:MAG: 50S ribosomal protein L3 [Thermoleophilia bacterium]|nr:50S ribosomal protein L3 [Thermoleophilia bacterium]